MIELEVKIEYLEKMYNQTLTHVNNSINLFWIILFGFISIAGIALYFVAKSAIETGIKNGISELKSENEKTRKEVENIFEILDIMLDADKE